MNNPQSDKIIKDEQKRLYREYKRKLAALNKVRKEKDSVGQVFTKGLLPIYVLYMLSLESSNGNDISHKIGERTKGYWVPSTGGIYPILKRLEKDGYISGKWDDLKKRTQKIYSITDDGLRELHEKKDLLKVKIEESLEVFKIIYNDLYK
jgi:DNA-binding PadR family transcriptional regulator